jgi:hypothetical protein
MTATPHKSVGTDDTHEEPNSKQPISQRRFEPGTFPRRHRCVNPLGPHLSEFMCLVLTCLGVNAYVWNAWTPKNEGHEMILLPAAASRAAWLRDGYSQPLCVQVFQTHNRAEAVKQTLCEVPTAVATRPERDATVPNGVVFKLSVEHCVRGLRIKAYKTPCRI